MGESEKCPYCGVELEEGYIISSRWITWSSGKPFPSSWHFIGEHIAKSADVPFIRGTGPNLPAHRCRKCSIILIRVPKMEKSNE